MSDYGVFEASSTDGFDEENQQRQAQRDLGRAIEAAREGFGSFLGMASDKDDYQDRLALVMNDLMQKVADAGVMPVPGVMRKVKAALRPEFRVASPQVENLEVSGYEVTLVAHDDGEWEFVVSGPNFQQAGVGLSREDVMSQIEDSIRIHGSRKQADAISGWENGAGGASSYQGTGFQLWVATDNYDDGTENWQQGEWSVYDETFSEVASGQESSVTSAVWAAIVAAEEEGFDTSSVPTSGINGSRRKAFNEELESQFVEWCNDNGFSEEDPGVVSEFTKATSISESDADYLRNFYGSRKKAGPGDGNGMKSEEELSHLFDDGEPDDNFKGEGDDNFSGEHKNNFQSSRRKHADAKADAISFISYLRQGGYRMPKDAGYPGGGGQLDDELYDYTNGDEGRIADIVQFLQDNWDFYAYGASRKQAEVNYQDLAYKFYEWLGALGFSGEELGSDDFDWEQIDELIPEFASDQGVSEEDVSEATAEYAPGGPGFFAKRKQADAIDGGWEDDLHGIGYAKCTPLPGGGFSLYMWSDSMQGEAETTTSTPEEARDIWNEWRRSDIGAPDYSNADF